MATALLTLGPCAHPRPARRQPQSLAADLAGRGGKQLAVPAVGRSRAHGNVLRASPVKVEGDVAGMTEWLDGLKYNVDGLVVAIAQHVDTGEILMQGFSDRNALSETLQTGLATFFSRSRKGRWCKGETSGNYLRVQSVFLDCDRDSVIYLCEPDGPTCHTGARTCWFERADLEAEGPALVTVGAEDSTTHVPRTTLLALEQTIRERRAAAEAGGAEQGGKPSWTARLLADPSLCCKKIREEAGELCQTWEQQEGRERAVSEMADLLYHSMVLLNVQGVEMEEVLGELRRRFGTSGIEEKASRKKQ